MLFVKLQILLLIFFVSSLQFLSAQSNRLDPQKFTKELSDKDYKTNEVFKWIDAPGQFPVGNTTVTWTVTDIHNNTRTATQIVSSR